MKSPIKEITSRKIFSAKLFDVEESHITYTTGEKVVHHEVNRLPTVSIFPLTNNNELCLVKEYRYLFGTTVIAAPAGFVDRKNESPLQTAKRELEEEVGIRATAWTQISKIHIASSVIKGDSYLFLAQGLSFGNPRPEEGEMIQLIKLPLSEAIKKVLDGEIAVAATIIGILLLDKLQQQDKL